MEVAIYAVIMVKLVFLISIKCTGLNETFLKSISYFIGVFMQYPLHAKTL